MSAPANSATAALNSLHDRQENTGKTAAKNAGWIAGCQLVQMAVGVLIGALVARSLGPNEYGLYNYAAAFTGLFGVWAGLGVRNIVIRDLVRRPSDEAQILGTAFSLQAIAGVISFAASVLAMTFTRGPSTPSTKLVWIFSASFFFTSFQVFGFWFEARTKFKLVNAIRMAIFAAFTIGKIALLIAHSGVFGFALLGMAEVAVSSLVMTALYRGAGGTMRQWRFDAKEARLLLREGSPLLIAGVAATLYMRMDQVMLGMMKNDALVGIYSAAVKISEAGYFIPAAAATALLPALTASRSDGESEYYRRFQKFFDLAALYGVAVALFTSLSARPLVSLLFGPAYSETATVLVLHAWGGVFVAIGIACKHWFLIEGLQRYTLYRVVAGALVNLALNLLSIPKFGAVGAAAATVAAQAMGLFLFNGINPNSRKIFRMQLKSLNIARGLKVVFATLSYRRHT